MQHLPKLPDVSGVQVGVDRVLVFVEPFIPKTAIPKNIDALTNNQKEKFYKDMQAEMQERRLIYGNLRRAIIMSIPKDMDKDKFPYNIHDIVFVPNQTDSYDIVNIDKTPLYFVGPRDIRLMAKPLSEDEAIAWDEDQKVYLETVVYPAKEVMPAPTGKKNADGSSYKHEVTPILDSPNTPSSALIL